MAVMSGVTVCQVGVLSFLENAFSPEKLGFVLAIRATSVMQCFLVILHKELLLDRILRKKKERTEPYKELCYPRIYLCFGHDFRISYWDSYGRASYCHDRTEFCALSC